jgi:hypothetical protein
MPALARKECGPPIRPCMLGNATGDLRDAKSSCFAILLRRSYDSDGPCTAGPTAARCYLPLRVANKHSEGLASATVHTSYCDRITRPICTLCQPIPAPDLGAPFSLKPSRFPYRKVRLTRRCGSMQARGKEEVNGKLVLSRSCTGALSCQKIVPLRRCH